MSISLTFPPHFTFLLGNLSFFILLLFCNPYIQSPAARLQGVAQMKPHPQPHISCWPRQKGEQERCLFAMPASRLVIQRGLLQSCDSSRMTSGSPIWGLPTTASGNSCLLFEQLHWETDDRWTQAGLGPLPHLNSIQHSGTEAWTVLPICLVKLNDIQMGIMMCPDTC